MRSSCATREQLPVLDSCGVVNTHHQQQAQRCFKHRGTYEALVAESPSVCQGWCTGAVQVRGAGAGPGGAACLRAAGAAGHRRGAGHLCNCRPATGAQPVATSCSSIGACWCLAVLTSCSRPALCKEDSVLQPIQAGGSLCKACGAGGDGSGGAGAARGAAPHRGGAAAAGAARRSPAAAAARHQPRDADAGGCPAPGKDALQLMAGNRCPR
jgi:hypothetical protein